MTCVALARRRLISINFLARKSSDQSNKKPPASGRRGFVGFLSIRIASRTPDQLSPCGSGLGLQATYYRKADLEALPRSK